MLIARSSRPNKKVAPASARAVIYCRISKDRTGERAGVERQEADCRALCERNGWQVVGVHVDNDISAYSGKPRPEWKRVAKRIKDGEADVLVGWHPDRFTRHNRELEDLIELVEASAVNVSTVQGGEYDLGTASGRLSARIVGSVARHDSEHSAERIRRAHLELAEKGLPSGGGRAFGYACANPNNCNVPDGLCPHDGLSIIAHEADLIREGARKVLDGRSMAFIADKWNAAGVPTPRGNQWVQQVVRKLLLAPRLVGKREHKGEVIGDAEWDPILDEDTHARVVAILTDPRRRTNTGSSVRKYPLAGIVYCSLCGQPMKTGVTNKAPAMICKKDGTRPKACGRIVVKMQPLLDTVRDAAFIRLVQTDDVANALADDTHDAGGRGAVLSELAALTQRQEDLETARFIEGTVSHDRYTKLHAQLQERIDALNDRLRPSPVLRDLAAIDLTADSLRAMWDMKGLDWQRLLLTSVIDRVAVLPAPHKGARFTPQRLRFHFRDLTAGA